jgi:L-amino acid N-acyltransferase YncA
VLTDPNRLTYQTIGAGGDNLAVIVDQRGVVRWFTHWPDHREEPGYETFLQALREI